MFHDTELHQCSISLFEYYITSSWAAVIYIKPREFSLTNVEYLFDIIILLKLSKLHVSYRLLRYKVSMIHKVIK